SGQLLDMVITNNDTLKDFQTHDMLYDITDELKAINFDMSRLEDYAPILGTYDGKLVSLPLSIQVSVLFYNKDIFDRFAVDYPRDGMTWEEVKDLAKDLTKFDEGVQY